EDPITLEELSTEFNVSRERVRQIEVRAFEKIQEAVKKNLAAREVPAAAAALLLPPLAEGLVDELLARDPLLEGQDGALPGGEADRQVDPVPAGDQVGVAVDVRGEVRQPDQEQVFLH